MRRFCDEEDLSTPQYTQEEGSRFQGKNENCRRQKGSVQEKGKRKEEIDSLKPLYVSLKSNEFRVVYEKANKYVTPYFILFVLEGQGSFKAGFVASKKVGKAHERNRAKRRMREIVRLNQRLIPENAWLVMVARRGILKAPFVELQRVFRRALAKIS